MANAAESNLTGTARFVVSLVPALLLLGLFFALVGLVGSAIGGMTGGLLGAIAVDGRPMTAPFTGTACAAYTYLVSDSRESSSRGGRTETVLAQGFHLQRAHLDGAGRRLTIGAFPGFETDLRHEGNGERDDRPRVLGARIECGG
jgi:hypothetical protein